MTRPSHFILAWLRAYSRPPALWFTFGLEPAVRRLQRERRKAGERAVDASWGRWA